MGLLSRGRWPETYLYFMDHVPPSFHIYMPDQPFLELEGGPRSGGAYHSGDLAYVFGSLDKVGYDWNEADQEVSAQIVDHWTQFAKTGNPNIEGSSDGRHSILKTFTLA